MSDDDTLVEDVSTVVHIGAPGERYETLSVLGRGGMGEVRMCRDAHVGRNVALKVEIAGVSGRFVREALVQGQLEHPSIVPVYDIGIDATSARYFTMKRIHGTALNDVLRGLRESRDGFAQYTQHKLLTAMASVCLAIDFAHVRGVVHRDIKPANVMLGVWGEVYLLDWGIAKVRGEDDARDAPQSTRPGSDVRIASSHSTQAGSLVGTPGYMAPEQLAGDAGIACDIYALGATLFEVLCLERFNRGTTVEERLLATITAGDDVAARLAAKHVPPELVTICERATRADPAKRYASARELHDALERYLEGDRDLESRRRAAARHVEEGERLLRAGDRPEAMRAVARAFAFDPENREALRRLVNLLKDAPERVPPEVDAHLAAEATALSIRNGRAGGRFGFASIVLVSALLYAAGARSTLAFAVFAVCALTVLWASARSRATVSFLAMTVIIVVLDRVFGSLVVVPTLVLGLAMTFTFGASVRPAVLVAGASAVIFGPLVLEALHILDASYVTANGRFEIVPHLVPFGAWTTPLLAAVTLLTMFPIYRGALSQRAAATELRRRIAIQQWNVEQLVPKEARDDESEDNTADQSMTPASIVHGDM